MAVASSGMMASRASATAMMPPGWQAVCLVSRNQVLVAPLFKVNWPRRTECRSTWLRRVLPAVSRVGRSLTPSSVGEGHQLTEVFGALSTGPGDVNVWRCHS